MAHGQNNSEQDVLGALRQDLVSDARRLLHPRAHERRRALVVQKLPRGRAEHLLFLAEPEIHVRSLLEARLGLRDGSPPTACGSPVSPFAGPAGPRGWWFFWSSSLRPPWGLGAGRGKGGGR